MSERTKIEHRPLTHAEVKLIKSLQLAKYRRQSNLFIQLIAASYSLVQRS